MKYLAAAFVWIGLTVIGVNFSSRLKKRCDLFKDIILMIENLSGEINYMSKPLDKIIHEISKNNASFNLPFIPLCNRFLQSGTDFPVAWEKSIEEAKLPLSSEERARLILFGKSIGKTDAENQKGIFNIYLSIFNSFNECAEKEKERLYTTSLTGCFLCGCALFILIL